MLRCRHAACLQARLQYCRRPFLPGLIRLPQPGFLQYVSGRRGFATGLAFSRRPRPFVAKGSHPRFGR